MTTDEDRVLRKVWREIDHRVIQAVRLSGIEKFEGKRENFILNTFIYLKPVKRFKNRSGVSEFWSFGDSTSKGVLDLLETIYLKLWKTVQRVTV